ncbi:hypothetical protein STTU_5093 [Streptomyces sp. Tu6071]|nr:hypothetical protein STTU_5093 [Streptomyces sp. Tu6071]
MRPQVLCYMYALLVTVEVALGCDEGTKGAVMDKGVGAKDLLALPAVISIEEANAVLAIGRSTGYALAKKGAYPVRVLRLGRSYRVVTAELIELLGVN